MTWQPIETAPKDGTPIYARKDHEVTIEYVWWDNNPDGWMGWEYSEPPLWWIPIPKLPEDE